MEIIIITQIFWARSNSTLAILTIMVHCMYLTKIYRYLWPMINITEKTFKDKLNVVTDGQ